MAIRRAETHMPESAPAVQIRADIGNVRQREVPFDRFGMPVDIAYPDMTIILIPCPTG